MKKTLILITLVIVGGFFACIYFFNKPTKQLNPIVKIIKPRPLLAYTFDNLRKTELVRSTIVIDKELTSTTTHISYQFHFNVPDKPGSIPSHTVSGMLTVPKKDGTHPVLVLLRGYISPETYVSGAGTVRVAQIFAENDFITIAPDFLGFGESDIGSENGFEDRFQTYTTVLTLLASLDTLNEALAQLDGETPQADTSRVGIWGHSNGGHIALSVLAISGKNYPTALWAPVSKSFPYSILYYADEFDDKGKGLRKALSEFETDYNTQLFSPTRYYGFIKAPIQVNQGRADIEVPYWWSDELVQKLKDKKIETDYYTYADADHNMLPSAWSLAVSDNVAFFKKHLAQ